MMERENDYLRCKVSLLQSKDGQQEPIPPSGRERLMWCMMGSGIALVVLTVGRLIK